MNVWMSTGLWMCECVPVQDSVYVSGEHVVNWRCSISVTVVVYITYLCCYVCKIQNYICIFVLCMESCFMHLWGMHRINIVFCMNLYVTRVKLSLTVCAHILVWCTIVSCMYVCIKRVSCAMRYDYASPQKGKILRRVECNKPDPAWLTGSHDNCNWHITTVLVQ